MPDLDRLTDDATTSTDAPEPTPTWSREQLSQLGVTTDLLTAARILHIGRTKAYQLARDGEFPVPVVRIGRTYHVAVPLLVDLLGLDKETRR